MPTCGGVVFFCPSCSQKRENTAFELVLLSQGVIEPVKFAKWTARIVPIVKADGTVRICGDYKLTINQVSSADPYPLRRIEDLFTSLSGGKRFSKLDLSHAYQQLVLNEQSKQFTTINTSRII